MYTSDIDALQQLPEGPATGLDFDWEDVVYQTNRVDCYVTCNITNINDAG